MKSNNNRTIILLFFSVFVIATCGLIYELLAGTVASYLMGDSVKQFSFIIGIYLSSMGLGSYLSKFLKDKWLERFIEIEILIGLIGGSSSILLFWLFSITPYFSFFLYGLVSIIGVLVGLEIPLLMNILRDKVTFTDLVSNIFTFDYIGALFASILFPLVFIPWLGIFDTSILTGIVNILVALYLMYFFRTQILNKVWLKIKALIVLIILLILLYFSKSILNTTEEMLYNENIIFSSTSSYQRFCITRIQNTFKLYLNNNLQFSTKDEYRYHEALVHPILSLSPKIENVLVLGGGDGMATREILKYADVKQITVVDLDPALTNFFKNNILFKKLNANAFNNPKVKIINQDAFVWLLKNKNKFDLAVIDFPDPSNYSLGKLYTTTFYKLLYRSLTDSGSIVVQTTSPFFAPKSFWCIFKTIKTFFPNTLAYHVYLPSFGEWGYSIAFKQKNNDLIPIRKLKSLRFYDYDIKKLTNFHADMVDSTVEVNKLDNQVLVRYFDMEWSKI